LLDSDLATLYGVETKALDRAGKRNRSRFPHDFMFLLTAEEAANLKCQFGTSSSGHGGRRRVYSRFAGGWLNPNRARNLNRS